MEQQLVTTQTLALFQTNKDQRQTLVEEVMNKIEQGEINPLEVHLQLKCMEDIIELLNSNTVYKAAVLAESEKFGEKKFTFHNAKIEIKEVGVKYDFTKTGDTVYETLDVASKQAAATLKGRAEFLKTVPVKGVEIADEQTGEMITVYPPAKSSTTSIAVSLK